MLSRVRTFSLSRQRWARSVLTRRGGIHVQVGNIDTQIALLVDKNAGSRYRFGPKKTGDDTKPPVHVKWSETKEVVGEVAGSDVVIVHKVRLGLWAMVVATAQFELQRRILNRHEIGACV